MITKVYFTKMQALGNDFVVLESITQNLVLDSKLATNIADRHFGIGCDQVLLIEAPRHPQEDFFYRIFNANGEEVSQCGNGARCVGRFIVEKGLSQKENLILGTHQGPVKIHISTPEAVTVFLPKPEFEAHTIPMHITPPIRVIDEYLGQYELPFETDYKVATILSLGNPHCVFCVSNINSVDLNQIRLQIEALHLFPQGINIGIMQVLAKNHIKLRVFERGAGETLACGSGACAAVIAGITHKMLSTEVQVDMAGGAALVHWPGTQNEVSLAGNTKCVFDGFFVLQNQPKFNILLQKY